MNTDEITTYKCERCHAHKSVNEVHNMSEGRWDPRYALNWYCRRCILDEAYRVNCYQCETDNEQLYRINQGVFCGPCIAEMDTVQYTLSNNGKMIFTCRLGTDEPSEEDPDTDKKWEELTRGAL